MAAPLSAYHQKRRFEKTQEPRGAAPKAREDKLRFVVQHHMASHDHYDLRLEWQGVLKSWAVPKGPSYSSHDKRLAVQVEDHPLEYRHFEGTIPKGQYGGGTVMLWDEGVWRPVGSAAAGFAAGSLKFTLEGSRLKGKWALVKMKPKAGEKDNNWLLIKEKDAYENVFHTALFTTSVRSGRSMAEIAADGDEGKTPMKKDTPAPKAAAKKKSARAGGELPARQEQQPFAGVAITHPEKLLYENPDVTKQAVAEYYVNVAPRMMPYVENRILSTVRCPGGIDSACFFRKHPALGGTGIFPVTVPSGGGGQGGEEYYYIKDAAGLLWEVQMNTLEFHPWGSRVETLDRPDIMVFDLDPDEGMALERIRQGVKDLKGLLDQLSLTSYLKTSGGKGYHVVLPLRPAAGWDEFHAFAQNIAKTMEAMWPDRYTSNVRKNKRNGRIFVDWLRNGKGATSVAPYSLRARKGAPVCLPIAWRELETVAPGSVKMGDVAARLKQKDPWEGFFENDQQLK